VRVPDRLKISAKIPLFCPPRRCIQYPARVRGRTFAGAFGIEFSREPR
jgi:hypothetical protein